MFKHFCQHIVIILLILRGIFMFLKNRLYYLSALSGLLTAVSFFSQYTMPLIFISYSILFYIVFSSRKKYFAISLFFSTTLYISTLSFVFTLDNIFLINNFLADLLILAVILIYCLISTITMYLFLLIFKFCKRDNFSDIFLISALFTLMEILNQYTLIIPFPWFKAGTTVAAFNIFIQSASLFGTSFISFLIFIINASLSYFFINRKNLKVTARAIAIVAIVFTGNILFGAVRLNMLNYTTDKQAVIIQSNFPGNLKSQTSSEYMRKTMLSVCKKSLTKNTMLALFPETSMCYVFTDTTLQKEIFAFSKENKLNILLGSTVSQNGKDYNCAVLISSNNKISKPYCKQALVPFGEYLPHKNILLNILPASSAFDIFSAGNECYPINSSFGKITPVICYETVFPQLVRKSIAFGGEIIAVITNDSWFLNTNAIYQNTCHSTMRATENERFLLCSGNCCGSCTISPTGEIIGVLPQNTNSALIANFSLIDNLTLYTVMGDIPLALICFVIIFLSAVWKWYYRQLGLQ